MHCKAYSSEVSSCASALRKAQTPKHEWTELLSGKKKNVVQWQVEKKEKEAIVEGIFIQFFIFWPPVQSSICTLGEQIPLHNAVPELQITHRSHQPMSWRSVQSTQLGLRCQSSSMRLSRGWQEMLHFSLGSDRVHVHTISSTGFG